METIEHNGREYAVTIERDDCIGAPWDEHDGHGEVSEWTTRAKMPGEMVLCEDRGSRRFYDFAGACQIARRDGWDAKPYNTGQETKRQQAAKAAMADFERLRGWCNDEWSWVYVTVTAKCDCCGDFTGRSETLGGIESDCGDYLDDIVRELAEEIEASIGVAA